MDRSGVSGERALPTSAGVERLGAFIASLIAAALVLGAGLAGLIVGSFLECGGEPAPASCHHGTTLAWPAIIGFTGIVALVGIASIWRRRPRAVAIAGALFTPTAFIIQIAITRFH
jgi:hypothetical protein